MSKKNIDRIRDITKEGNADIAAAVKDANVALKDAGSEVVVRYVQVTDGFWRNHGLCDKKESFLNKITWEEHASKPRQESMHPTANGGHQAYFDAFDAVLDTIPSSAIH